MPHPTPPPAASHARPLHRWSIGLNVALQLVLVLVLFGAANYLSYRHYTRRDLTPSRDHSLSEATLNYLGKLSKDVDVTLVFSRDSEVMPDMRALVEEYRRAKPTRLHVEELDPARDLERAEQLKLTQNITLKSNGILVRANSRTRFIGEEEIIIKGINGNRARPSVDFRGEDALTSAIIGLMEGEVRRFHFVVGKGAASGKDLGQSYQTLAALGVQQNFEVVPLNLTEVDKVPEDSSGLLLIGPKYDLTDQELTLLNNFWQGKRGALLVLLDPNGETPRLHNFLRSNGVNPRNDRVLYAESTSAGPKKQFSVQTVFLPGSPVSQPFADTASSFSGQTQSLDIRPDSQEVRQQHIEITPLATAAPRYWGETNYLQDLPVIDGDDTGPPVYLAASVERGHVSDERLRVDSSRMVVVGNATLLDPATRLAVHQDFIAAALNWMMNRERLIGITPKRKQFFRIELTDEQRKKIFWVTAVLMPGSVLMLGFLVWNHRRA